MNRPRLAALVFAAAVAMSACAGQSGDSLRRSRPITALAGARRDRYSGSGDERGEAGSVHEMRSDVSITG